LGATLWVANSASTYHASRTSTHDGVGGCCWCST